MVTPSSPSRATGSRPLVRYHVSVCPRMRPPSRAAFCTRVRWHVRHVRPPGSPVACVSSARPGPLEHRRYALERGTLARFALLLTTWQSQRLARESTLGSLAPITTCSRSRSTRTTRTTRIRGSHSTAMTAATMMMSTHFHVDHSCVPVRRATSCQHLEIPTSLRWQVSGPMCSRDDSIERWDSSRSRSYPRCGVPRIRAASWPRSSMEGSVNVRLAQTSPCPCRSSISAQLSS